MRAYSKDLRQRIVQAVHQGQGVMQVGRRFDVGHDGVRRFVDQHQREGHLKPKPRPGRHRRLSGALPDALREQLLADRASPNTSTPRSSLSGTACGTAAPHL